MKWNESEHPRDGDGKFTNSSKEGTPAERQRLAEIGIRIASWAKRRTITNKEWAEIEKDKDGHNVVKINLDASIQKQLRAERDINVKRKIVERYIMDNLRGKYPTNDGREVYVNRRSADKLSHQASGIKITILPQIADLIKVGNFLELQDVEHKIFKAFAYYRTRFLIDNETYSGVLSIGIGSDNRSTLYELNQIKNGE